MDLNSEKFDVLRGKIEERILGRNTVYNDEVIDLHTLYELISKGMNKYNDVLVKDADKFARKLNKETFLNRVFKMEVPLIRQFIPCIDENGNRKIDVLMTNEDWRYRGYATIDDRCNVTIDFLRHDYSLDKTKFVLSKYPAKYIEFFNTLSEFEKDFPNTRCEWNSSYEEMNQTFDDGFLKAYFYLERPDRVALGFSTLEDSELSRVKSKKYGELYDYIDFYKFRILKDININIDDLNDLYKKIVLKELEMEKGPSLRRVK